jgi:integral membrane protein (TIGR01906 family)
MSGVSLATTRPVARSNAIARVGPALVSLATAFVVLGVGLVAAANPWYLHGALDRSASDLWLGLPPDQVHAVSDSTVTELFVGPGTFAQTFTDPATGETVRFYQPAEASHLRDAQLLARLFVAAVGVALIGLVVAGSRMRERSSLWRSVQRGAVGAAVALVVIGTFFTVAFEPAFTLFHEVFFPQGNWEFDPLQDRMVQLYNEAFWNEVTVVFAAASIAAAVAIWLIARQRRRSISTAVGDETPADRRPRA